jgi:hypothetical protein
MRIAGLSAQRQSALSSIDLPATLASHQHPTLRFSAGRAKAFVHKKKKNEDEEFHRNTENLERLRNKYYTITLE